MEPPKPQEGHDGWPIAGASRSDVSDPGSRLPLLPRRELPPLPDLDDELLDLGRTPPPPPPESPRPASQADLSLELGLPGLGPEGPRRLDPPVPGRRELPPLPDLDEELQRLDTEPDALPKFESHEASLFPESKLPPLPDLDEELKRLEAEPVLNLGAGLFPESTLPPLPDLEEELRRLEEVPPELGPLKPVSEEDRFRSLPPLPNLEDELRLLDPVVPSEPKQLPPLPDLSLELQRLESEQPKAPPLPAARLEPPSSGSKKSEAFEFPSLFGDEPEPVAEETSPEPPAKPALGLPSFFEAKSKAQPEKPRALEPPPPLEAPTPKPKMLEPPPPLEETSAPRTSFLNQRPAVPEPPSLFSDPPATETQAPSLFGARAEEPEPPTFLLDEPPSLFADKPVEPEPPSFLTAPPEPPSVFAQPTTDPPPAAGGLFGEPLEPASSPLADVPSLFDEPAPAAAKPQRARQPEPPSLFGEPEPVEPEAFDEPSPGIIIDDDTYDDTVCVGDLDRDAVPMIRSARGFSPPAAKEPPPPPPPPKKERLKFDPATAPVAERANPFETSQMKVVFPQAQATNPRETSEMKVVTPGQKPVNVFETSKMKVVKPDPPAPEGVRSTTQITELRQEQKKGRSHVMTAAAAVADREAPPRPPPKPAKGVSAADTGESTTFVKGHFKAMLGSDGPRASREDIAILTRQMAAMIAAGIPVHSTLEFCIDGESKLSPVMEDIAIKVSSGIALSHAMRDYPRVFDQVFIGLVQTGEMSGQLSEIFLKLAELLERQVAMKKKVVAALTYPAILMIVATIGVMGFVYFVLPTITPLFESMKIDLPLPTRILIMSRRGIPIAFFGTLLVALEIWIFRPYWERELRKRHEFRRKLHSIPLRLPMIGQTVEKVITSRVLYAMASMLDVGIGMAQALARAENAAGNEFVAHRLRLARGDLADGMTVYECLSAHEVFPPGALQLISVGEESADLAKMFKYVARYYEEEVEYSLATLTSMLEPMIMLVMGIVVGFITLSAAMPTIKLLQTIS
ncbi:MAG: type II secretion system F family protein [Vulcanimicrobiota bacterium]